MSHYSIHLYIWHIITPPHNSLITPPHNSLKTPSKLITPPINKNTK